MNIGTRTVYDVLIVDVSGRLDSSTAGEASDELVRIAQGDNAKVVLDLDKLEYVSSAGLSAILRAAKLLQTANGELKICRAQGVVKEVLETSGFRSLLRIYDTEQAAVEDF